MRPDPPGGSAALRAAYKVAGIVVAVAAAIYFAACAYLFAFQRSYVFVPGGVLASPQEAGLDDRIQVVTIEASDGTKLTGWFAEASSDRPTILYFHGNAGNVSDRADRFRQILDSGFGLLAMSYRGYAGSGGSPSQAKFFSDGLETFDWLVARTTNIVAYGESLGTATATYVSTQRPVHALVLEAPFTAALDIARATYPWIPVKLLMLDPFMTRDMIGGIHAPLLVVHGTRDEVVPVEQGRALLASAPEPKKLAIINGAEHGNLWKNGLWPIVLGFLRAERITTTR